MKTNRIVLSLSSRFWWPVRFIAALTLHAFSLAAQSADTPPDANTLRAKLPAFASAEIAQQIAKGRAQFDAGDFAGARETFQAVETQEPDNLEVKGFLL